MSERKAVIKNADMAEEMQQEAVDIASQVLGTSIMARKGYSTLFAHEADIVWAPALASRAAHSKGLFPPGTLADASEVLILAAVGPGKYLQASLVSS